MGITLVVGMCTDEGLIIRKGQWYSRLPGKSRYDEPGVRLEIAVTGVLFQIA